MNTAIVNQGIPFIFPLQINQLCCMYVPWLKRVCVEGGGVYCFVQHVQNFPLDHNFWIWVMELSYFEYASLVIRPLFWYPHVLLCIRLTYSIIAKPNLDNTSWTTGFHILHSVYRFRMTRNWLRQIHGAYYRLFIKLFCTSSKWVCYYHIEEHIPSIRAYI